MFQYDSSLSSKTCNIGRNFIFVSANSISGSESRIMPQPANSDTSLACTNPERSATANSRMSLLSNQPISAPYQPRTNNSCSRIKANAESIGNPPNAAKECTFLIRSNTEYTSNQQTVTRH